MDKLEKQLAARSCRSLLFDLAGRDVPVELHLLSGKTFSGRVVEVASEAQQETLILAHDRTNQLTYLTLSAICGVTLSVSPSVIPVVTGGRFQSEAELEPLSRLAFTRRLAELETGLKNELGRPLPLKRDAELEGKREGLAPLLSSVESLLKVIGGLKDDELGQEALSKLEAISLGAGPEPRVSLQGTSLVVVLAERVSLESWQGLVESAL